MNDQGSSAMLALSIDWTYGQIVDQFGTSWCQGGKKEELESTFVFNLTSYSWQFTSAMIFPFLFFLPYFLLLIPLYSIWTAFPFHSHITSPRGSPRFPYLWLTSLEAYFSFYSHTALHCPALPYDSYWLPFTLRLCLPFISLPYD